DSSTLEQLKELSSRRVNVEAINSNRSITEAIAREMSGGLTSQCEQDIQKLERYLPLLQNLVHHIDSIGDKPLLSQLTPKLRISWTSPLNSSSIFNLMGPKFFQIDNLHFELGIVLFFYAAMLREWGSQVLVTDLVRSTTLFRRAAGVYHYLAHEVLPSLKDARTPEGPPEATPSVTLVMSFICLAEAQIVTTIKAEEKKTADTLLSKLHYGVVQLFDEATGFYATATKECKDISPILMDYISCSKVVHELRSYKYMAQAVKTEGQIGIAIGLLKQALNNVQQKNVGGIESWRMVIKEDIDSLTALLKKYEQENEFVWREKVPFDHNLPSLQGKKITTCISYSPERWERTLALKI
ncbi:programmed cell death 6-interacting protein isoform X1, partial [Tanacetum coccineum]